MESVSVILIVVGAVIIGVVLLLRLGLRRRSGGEMSIGSRSGGDARTEEPEFDPLFAVDTKVSEVSDRALASIGTIVAAEPEPRIEPSPAAPAEPAAHAQAAESHLVYGKRRPPRVAEDPHRVVVLNVMANGDQVFSGQAVRDAVANCGFEYGDWQIFHYYSPAHANTPPLFSLANMVKPGSFDLERMADITTAGLSLFMVPAGEDEDIVTFDTMLAKTRQLAEALGGEVRDARRSVLTRQAIGHIREQLNEWRHKAQVAQH
jgi:cell division protein ZipA